MNKDFRIKTLSNNLSGLDQLEVINRLGVPGTVGQNGTSGSNCFLTKSVPLWIVLLLLLIILFKKK